MSHEYTPEDAQFDEALVRLVGMKPKEFASLGEWAHVDPQSNAEATRAAFSAAGYEYTGERSIANACAAIGRMVGAALTGSPEK